MIDAALEYIPADDRRTWLRVGTALKTELGEDGYGAWDEWSKTSDAYDPAVMSAQWRSLRAGTIKIGTLYYIARENGWKPDDAELKPKRRGPEGSREAARRSRSSPAGADREGPGSVHRGPQIDQRVRVGLAPVSRAQGLPWRLYARIRGRPAASDTWEGKTALCAAHKQGRDEEVPAREQRLGRILGRKGAVARPTSSRDTQPPCLCSSPSRNSTATRRSSSPSLRRTCRT